MQDEFTFQPTAAVIQLMTVIDDLRSGGPPLTQEEMAALSAKANAIAAEHGVLEEAMAAALADFLAYLVKRLRARIWEAAYDRAMEELERDGGWVAAVEHLRERRRLREAGILYSPEDIYRRNKIPRARRVRK